MQLLKFVPIKLCLYLILGILAGHYFDVKIPIAVIFTLLCIGFLAFVFFKKQTKNTSTFGVLAVLTTFSLGISAISLSKPQNQANHYSHQHYNQQHVWKFKIEEALKSSIYSNRYIVKVLSMDGRATTGKIILSSVSIPDMQKWVVDNELLAIGKLSEINAPLNPHQFDYKSYLKGLGIYHQFYLRGDNHLQTKHQSTTIYGLAATLRSKITSKLQQANFGTEELSIIQALLLGQRTHLSETTYTHYKNAGAVHILAVSGLHIGILLAILQFLLHPLERLPKGKTIKLITIVVLLWCFALIAGFSASVVRAVAMFSFVAYALYLNRPSNTFNILALSMGFILLVINPMLLFQAGFQMSYAAVIAIVWIYPLLQQLVSPKNLIVKKIGQLLSVSCAAQVGVLPISLFYFHQFPSLFFVSNLIIIPFLGLILGMGILVIVLALCNSLPHFIVELYNTLIHLMNTLIAWVAEQEAFIFKAISFDAIQLLLSYFIIIATIFALTNINFKKASYVLVGIITFQIWCFYTTYTATQKEDLLLAHQSKNTILLHRYGTTLAVHVKNKNKAERIITDYKIGERISAISYKKLQNSYFVNNKTILVIDSSAMHTKQATHYVVLTQSPKINLDRLIDSLNPKEIIADGSNYKSYIKRWKQTCLKRKLPFHYTSEKGAYYFK